MRFRLVPVVIAALVVGACSEGTAPEAVNEGVNPPNDGSIVFLSAEEEQVPEGLSFMVNGASGRWAVQCTQPLNNGRRCLLLWVGAYATTTVAAATCASGVLTIACAGAVIGAAYTWDQYYTEPDCWTCRDPYNLNTSGQWYRVDYLGREEVDDGSGDNGGVR